MMLSSSHTFRHHRPVALPLLFCCQLKKITYSAFPFDTFEGYFDTNEKLKIKVSLPLAGIVKQSDDDSSTSLYAFTENGFDSAGDYTRIQLFRDVEGRNSFEKQCTRF